MKTARDWLAYTAASLTAGCIALGTSILVLSERSTTEWSGLSVLGLSLGWLLVSGMVAAAGIVPATLFWFLVRGRNLWMYALAGACVGAFGLLVSKLFERRGFHFPDFGELVFWCFAASVGGVVFWLVERKRTEDPV